MGFFSKSSDKGSDSEKDKWKDKYLNLIDAHESSEMSHKQNHDLLCKSIVRMSIAASKLDPQLDPYLQRIRDHIKQGFHFEQFKTELDSFTTALSRLDEGVSQKQEADNDISLLFSFLFQLYSSEKHHQALESLYKTFRPGDDTEKLFAEIANIIQEEPTVERLDNQSAEQTQSIKSEIDPNFICKQLIKLLERIEIPDGYFDKIETLKQQLESCVETVSLETLLNNTTLLLIEINTKNQSKQKEVDKFLTHVTEQLTELGLTITDSGIALMDASMERIKLDQSVSDQMSDLQHRTSSATQLEPLKQVISLHIVNITKEIQEHKQKEAIERDKYQQQLEELSQKIKALESETGELQSKLITANTNAQRDVLTDLPNRLAYDDRLKMEIARWQRYHTPLCIVVWDIDYFKKVNDQYGHQVGDKVLIHISNIFINHIRKSDFIARFGGEEFIMLLPHTNKHSAVKVTENLRNLIAQNPLVILNKPLSITLSGGITQFFKGDTHESAFERADQALYRAKEMGRNRCCVG